MKKYFSILLFIFCAACAGSPAWNTMQISKTRWKAEENNKNMMALQVGDNREQALRKMGMPAKREAYRVGQNSVVEFFFYRTSGWSSSNRTDRDQQFTPVAIRDNKVVGWGRNYYENVVRIAVGITAK